MKNILDVELFEDQKFLEVPSSHIYHKTSVEKVGDLRHGSWLLKRDVSSFFREHNIDDERLLSHKERRYMPRFIFENDELFLLFKMQFL